MEISESQTITGQLIEIRCPDLAAKAAEITEAQIIRYNDQEVGPLLLSASGCV